MGTKHLAALTSLLVAACSSTGPGKLSTDRPNETSRDKYVIVRNDNGGDVVAYALVAAKLRQSGARVHISGKCLSACTVYLTLPARQVCIVPGTMFGFHSPIRSSARGLATARNYLLSNYPPWVREWIAVQGGLSSKLITMDYGYASQHLKTCSGA